jgi:hypothetical protein
MQAASIAVPATRRSVLIRVPTHTSTRNHIVLPSDATPRAAPPNQDSTRPFHASPQIPPCPQHHFRPILVIRGHWGFYVHSPPGNAVTRPNRFHSPSVVHPPLPGRIRRDPLRPRRSSPFTGRQLRRSITKSTTSFSRSPKPRALWPQWYATVDERFDRERWPTTERELCLTEASHLVRGLSPAWFRKARSACRRGRLPLVHGVSTAEQLRQLALALDPSGPIVLLAVSSPEATPTRMHTLARAADWLATQAACALLLLLPDAWAASPELDPVNYDAVQVTADDESVDETPLPPDQPRVVGEPPVGRPHAGSAGPQRGAGGERVRTPDRPDTVATD